MPFYATAFLTAAKLAGYDVECCQSYRQMGYHFGMSIELGQEPISHQHAQSHMHKCEQIFVKINRGNSSNSSLEKAIRELHSHVCGMEEFAVV